MRASLPLFLPVDAVRTIIPVTDPATRLPRQPPYGQFALHGTAARLTHCAQAQSNSWLGRRVALALRKLVLANRRKVIDCELWGLRIRWHPLDNVTDRHALFLTHSWDPVERAFQDRHLPAQGVYLDVGANTGLYSLLALRRLDARGILVAVEPNPELFERLMINIALNHPRARLKLYPCGVAEREGRFTLNLIDGNLGGGSLVSGPGGGDQVSISCRPLYDLVREAELARIDFLKIDIEGYEANALNPFFERAPRRLWPRFVNIESLGGIDWASRGYVIAHRTRQNTLLMLEDAAHDSALDCT